MDVHRHDVGARPAACVGHRERGRHRPVSGHAAGRRQPADLERGVGEAKPERVQRVIAAALAEVGARQLVEELRLVAERRRGTGIEVPAGRGGV